MLLLAAVVVGCSQGVDVEGKEQAAIAHDFQPLGFVCIEASGINQALNKVLLIGLDNALGLLLGILGVIDLRHSSFGGHKGNAFLKVSHLKCLLVMI